MILVDLNNVIFSTISVQFNRIELSEDLLRHMTLNCLRSYKSKFSEQYGEMVICCDSVNNWRRQIFPYYKASRKKARDQSHLDWGLIFDTMDKIKVELMQYFPYRFIQIEQCEADDIIAVLTETYFRDGPVLIISSDKDFTQLQRYQGVDQYDPIRKRWIKEKNPDLYLKSHIITGDSGDGIPNIRSADNVFVIGERQKTVSKKFLEEHLKVNFDVTDTINNINETLLRNFHRNKQLIDLTQTPKDLKVKICDQFEAQANKERKNLFNYFVKYKLKNLMDQIQDF